MENNSSRGETKNAASNGEPWCGLLAGAAPRDHIVQLYQDQQFLNRAVCRHKNDFPTTKLKGFPNKKTDVRTPAEVA
ncbi:MAG: hypothetical protein WB660_03520 [Candidatus Sulfotelmatobacter sp.]